MADVTLTLAIRQDDNGARTLYCNAGPELNGGEPCTFEWPLNADPASWYAITWGIDHAQLHVLFQQAQTTT